MNFSLSLSQIIAELIHYKYLILFPLALFEGPVTAFAAGFLIRIGVLNFLPTFSIFLLCDIIPDSMFYFIGYFGYKTEIVRKYLSSFRFFNNHFDKVTKLWKNHPWKTIFFGKVAYGMALPFLISAGMVRLPFKKFFSYTFQVTILQYSAMLALGYTSGHLFTIVSKYIYLPYYFFTIFVILFVIIFTAFGKFSRRKVTEENNY